MPVKGRRVTRQVLLDGAHDILDNGAYRDLTVDRLSKHLSMSKSTLYKYYIGKDGVIIELLEEVCGQTERDLASIAGTGTPAEELTAISHVFSSFADRLPKAVILQREKLPRVSKRRLKSTTELLTAAVAACLRRGVDAGSFTISDADVAATSFTAACFAVMASTAESNGRRSEAVDKVLGLIAPGLVAAA